MNIKIKAAGITVGLIISAFAIAELAHAGLSYFKPEQVMNALGYLAIAGLVYVFYKLVLANLEYKESLQKIKDMGTKKTVDQ